MTKQSIIWLHLPYPCGFTHNEIPPIHLLYNKQKMASGLMVDNDTLSVHCVSDRWPFYLETPCMALVLQPHSAISNLSLWHCSIMHLPMCSPLSTNVFSESYISRKNGREEQVGSATVLRREKVANFCLVMQLAVIWKKRQKASATHSIVLFFCLCFSSLPWLA